MAEFITNLLEMGAANFYRNTTGAFAQMKDMELQKWIRIVAVVGAYLLIRPYFINLGAKKQEKEYAKARAGHAEQKEKEKHVGANSFRDSTKVSEDTDSEEDAKATSSDVKWGGKARKKQRQAIRKILDQEEMLRKQQQEDDEDKDIQEFLHD
ncbi:hypothetical protein BTUL_0003g00430 [Botrytis tulipae]|uniref:Uncharacterized protein n=2 Tax=Botrytis TaxID=33196 RepID=A0A4Z1F838_9HELO|nr:uncharacterized protein EAE97_000435 [Botrytis byssoidea]KAF7904367.1 hypothetical protein EAF00_001701 [Botryotinia globosa]KAF7955176.1 hypothetical protein EAE97_000435 [Botrytis byssoidea]TGO19589.1 hypothetical protein BTUL_0003g00430 [Botrytis tulipae]